MMETIRKKYPLGKAGFSLSELMIVMAMVAVLAAIATPSILRGIPEKRLRSATRNLYADLQKARLLAVKHNTTVNVTFDTAKGTYSYCTQFDATVTPYLCIESKTVTLENGVTYGSGSAGDGNGGGECNVDKKPCDQANAFSFSYKGTANRDTVYLQNNNDDICYAIAVSTYGNVKIRRFNGKSWDEK